MKEAFAKIKESIANIHRVVKTDEDLEWNRAIYKCSTIVSEVEAEFGKDINVRGNGWIDVKDRLPENDGYYLTCDHKGNIHVFYHHPSYVKNGSNMAFGICKNHPQYYKPIAWMELPKPYTRKKGV